MMHTISFRFGNQDPEKRRSDFVKILSNLPGWEENEMAHCSIGTSEQRLNGTMAEIAISDVNLTSAIRDLLAQHQSEKLIVNVRCLWPAWRPTTISRDEEKSRYRLDNLPVVVSYYGSESDLSRVSVRSEFGDCAIQIDGFAINYFSQTYNVKNVDEAELARTDRHRQRQENVARFQLFIECVANEINPHTIIETQSMFSSYGAFGASTIYHDDAIEFHRDLLRSLWIMDQYASILSRSQGGKGWYDKNSWYFSDAQLFPEKHINPQKLESCFDRCNAVFEREKSTSPESLEIPVVDRVLMSLMSNPHELFDSVSSIVELEGLVNDSDLIEANKLGNGFVVYHNWYLESQRTHTFFHSLVDCILARKRLSKTEQSDFRK